MAPSGWQLCISDPLHTCPLPLCLCENIGRQRRLQQAVSARKRKETETPDRAAKRRLENAASTRKCTPLQSAQKDTDIHVREIATDILQRRDIDGETLQFISSPEFHQASSACPFVFPPPPTLPSTATPTAPRKHPRGDVDDEYGFCDDDDDGGDETDVNIDDLQDTSPGECKVDALAKYLLCTFAPWQSTPLGLVFEFNVTGLAELCRQWDRHDASLVNRQRYRYLSNVMLGGHRNSHNER